MFDVRDTRFPVLRVCAALACLALAAPAYASMPVRKAQTGCVMMTGEFFTQDGYRLTPVDRSGVRVDLARYRGQRLRLDGWLHPGDRYTLAGPPRLVGSCRGGR